MTYQLQECYLGILNNVPQLGSIWRFSQAGTIGVGEEDFSGVTLRILSAGTINTPSGCFLVSTALLVCSNLASAFTKLHLHFAFKRHFSLLPHLYACLVCAELTSGIFISHSPLFHKWGEALTNPQTHWFSSSISAACSRDQCLLAKWWDYRELPGLAGP